MTTWFTVREAADYVRVSEGTIREAIKLGYLEAYTIGDSGTRIGLTDTDLDAWMMSRPWEPRSAYRSLD
jgi:excisionase family DNA binding protein